MPALVAGVAVLGNVILGAIAAAQNAQLIAWVPARYLLPEYLLGGYGVALFLVYLAAKATCPAAAAVRLRLVNSATRAFSLINVGESEANEVRIGDIQFDNHPWTLRSGEVGSIVSRGDAESPHVVVPKREIDNACVDCLRRRQPPNGHGEYFLTVAEHIIHALSARTNKSAAEAAIIGARVVRLPIDFSVFVAVTFFDGRARDVAYHRLDFRWVIDVWKDSRGIPPDTGDIRYLNSVYLRRKESDAVVRVHSRSRKTPAVELR